MQGRDIVSNQEAEPEPQTDQSPHASRNGSGRKRTNGTANRLGHRTAYRRSGGIPKPVYLTTRGRLTGFGKRTAGWVGTGLNRFLGRRDVESLGIILYHRVAPNVRDVPKPTINVTPDRFREQLSGLLARGFSFWPLRKVLASGAKGTLLPPRTVAVTFDDGFENVYTNAWPVLRELNVPATVFVNTAYLDSRDPFPFDPWGVIYRDHVPAESYRPLTSAQCEEMTREGPVELGAHTHTHEDFRGRPDDFRKDLQTSLDILRSRFGQREVTFAFPFGKPSLGFTDRELTQVVRESGAICALTTEDVLVDPLSDPFRWGRFNVYDWDSSATLAAKLEGWYTWAPKTQEWFSRAVSSAARRPVSN